MDDPIDTAPIQITSDWFMLTTEHGAFFGYTAEQVKEKADVAKRRATIALAERHNFLQLMERQRGVRLA